jgi:hypothetical protein
MCKNGHFLGVFGDHHETHHIYKVGLLLNSMETLKMA